MATNDNVQISAMENKDGHCRSTIIDNYVTVNCTYYSFALGTRKKTLL